VHHEKNGIRIPNPSPKAVGEHLESIQKMIRLQTVAADAAAAAVVLLDDRLESRREVAAKHAEDNPKATGR